MSDDGSLTSTQKRTVVNRRDFIRVAGASSIGVVVADMITPATAATSNKGKGQVRQFIRKVKEARLFDLSPVWDENSPVASVNPAYSMKLNRTHGPFDPTDPDFSDDHTRGTRGMFNDGGQLSFTSEVQHFSGQHGAPSIDALGHIGHNGFLFGHVDAAAAK